MVKVIHTSGKRKTAIARGTVQEAVSYTHLDVYKRQRQYCSAAGKTKFHIYFHKQFR